MIKVYQSNNLTSLIHQICKIIYHIYDVHPIQKDIFIVENKTIKHWINKEIAYHMGISANIKFMEFNNFICKILYYMKPNKNYKYDQHLYSLQWTIMNIIEKNNIVKYIKKHDSIFKKYEFSKYISKLFNNYSLYRINWINNWNNNIFHKILFNKHKWQIDLWNLCSKKFTKQDNILWNYHKIIDILSKNIKLFNITNSDFPKNIFIINNFSINEYQFKILKIISKIININIFTVVCNNAFYIPKNCTKQTTYTINKKINYKYNIHTKNYNFINNQLLYQWGKKGFECLLLFTKYNNIYIKKIIKKIPHNSLLNYIKNKLNNHDNYIKQKIILNPLDKSISIYICNTILHEIQVLYKNISYILNNQPNILINDIIVTTYDLDVYIPFIQAVFQSPFQKNNIPYVICKKKNKNIIHIFHILDIIFTLPENNLDYKDIFNILSNDTICKKFNIKEEEISIIKQWTKDVNIIWNDYKNINKHHNTDNIINNTWTFGINRILLSLTFIKKKQIWNNIIPYKNIESSHTDLLNKFIIFIKTIKKWKKKLLYPKKIISYINILKEIQTDFITNNDSIIKEFNKILQKWNQIIQTGINVNYNKKINIIIIYHQLHDYFKNKYVEYHNIIGKLSFCPIQSIITIPYKIIYILGFNTKIKSETNDRQELNLMHIYPNKHDKNIQYTNYYYFLHILNAVKKNIYISYYEYSNNHIPLHYSYMIENLINYITNNFIIFKNNNIMNKKELVSHLIHPNDNVENKKNVFIKKNNYRNICIMNDSKIISKKINFKKMILFWKNPIYYFFNNQLKIQFHTDIIYPEKTSNQPFLIHPLNKYLIKKKIIQYQIKNKNINKLFYIYKNLGILPNKNFDIFFWKNKIKKTEKLSKKILQLDYKYNIQSFNINIQEYQIYGKINLYNNQKILIWKPNILKFYNIMELWLTHLIYCSVGGKKTSIMLNLPNNITKFEPIKKNIASIYLGHYIKGYIQGLQKPIILIQSGIEWISTLYNKNKKIFSNNKKKTIQAEKKLFNTWHGNVNKYGEKQNIFIKKIIPILNKKSIKIIKYNAKKWIIPILKKKKIEKF